MFCFRLIVCLFSMLPCNPGTETSSFLEPSTLPVLAHNALSERKQVSSLHPSQDVLRKFPASHISVSWFTKSVKSGISQPVRARRWALYFLSTQFCLGSEVFCLHVKEMLLLNSHRWESSCLVSAQVRCCFCKTGSGHSQKQSTCFSLPLLLYPLLPHYQFQVVNQEKKSIGYKWKEIRMER